MSPLHAKGSASPLPEAPGAGDAPPRRRHSASRTRRRALRPVTRAVRLFEVLALGVAVAAIVAVGAIIVGPRFFPYQALIVRSGSMSPTIPTGSVVFYRREAASKVQVGQIILFAEPGKAGVWVTHRVHQVVHGPGGVYFVTKGDANAVADNWRIEATGEGWVAVFHVPDIGYALSYLGTGIGRLWLVTVPALVLGALMLFEVWRPGRSRRRRGGRHRRQAPGGRGLEEPAPDGVAERRQAAWG